MDFFKILNKTLQEYGRIFRRQDLPPLIPSKLYDLFPKSVSKIKVATEYSWPDFWPSYDKCGVYFVLDDNLDVLYIGKASMTNSLSDRLSRWFGYDKDRSSCKPRDVWAGKPRYVVTIAVESTLTFEAPALEEFLISNMMPKENTRGRQEYD